MNIFQLYYEGRIRSIGGGLGVRLRRLFYKKKLGGCGKNLRIDVGVVLEGLDSIFVGDDVWIDKNSILIAGKVNLPDQVQVNYPNQDYKFEEGELRIGSNVHFAPGTIVQAHGGIQIGNFFTASAGCKIYSLSNDPSRCKNGTYNASDIYYCKSQIVIEDNVWLGLNTIVLAGTIHQDCFIAPNSVVLKSIEKNSKAAGNPALKIKDRIK